MELTLIVEFVWCIRRHNPHILTRCSALPLERLVVRALRLESIPRSLQKERMVFHVQFEVVDLPTTNNKRWVSYAIDLVRTGYGNNI